MSFYLCLDNQMVVSSANGMSKTSYKFNGEFETETVNINQIYKHSAYNLSEFRNSKIRFVLGNMGFKKVQIYLKALDGKPSGTITDFTEVTDQFTINIFSGSGVVDIQATNKFKTSNSYTMLYIAVDKNFSSVPLYTVKENLHNITPNSDNKYSLKENENFTLKYNTKDNFRIDVLTSNIGDVTIDQDNINATITGVATENIVVNGSASKKYFVHITGTLKNCTCNYLDNEMYKEDKPIHITPDDNFEFTGVYTFLNGAGTETGEILPSGVLEFKPFSISGDLTLNDVYEATPKVEKISNMSNIYHVTDDELRQLSEVRFYGNGATLIDYGTFISALYKLPFTINPDLITGKANIVLGNYDSDINVDILKTYNLKLSLGSITTPEKYHNVYDYINTTCILHIPYFNDVFVEPEYIINQTITINVIIDLYTGNALCELTSTFTNEVFETINGKIGIDIPFMQKSNNSFTNSIGNILNTFNCAYVEVKRNKPYHSFNEFGEPCKDFGTLNKYTGYIECNNINLVSEATSEEQEEIKGLLKGGIFINEK